MCVRVRACVNAKPIVKYNTGYCVCVCDDFNYSLVPILLPVLSSRDTRLQLTATKARG